MKQMTDKARTREPNKTMKRPDNYTTIQKHKQQNSERVDNNY